MYEAHPVFVQPENENIKTWRYMDFTKLVSLMDSRRIFFTHDAPFGSAEAQAPDQRLRAQTHWRTKSPQQSV